MIETLRPKDRAAWLRVRHHDVTASQIGALFGEHEYLTAYELWARKTGRIAGDEDETPGMRRGRLLEAVAVQLIREDHPDWKIEHNAAANVYWREPETRMGATPDVIVNAKGRGLGVIQIKSVEASVFRRKWLDADGEVDPPLWIALQAILEAHLTGATWAAVAPLVVGFGLDMPIVEVPLVDGVIDAMRLKVADFWQMVEDGREPIPDYTRDGASLSAIYGLGDPETEVDLSGDNRIHALIAERAFAKEAIGKYSQLVDTIDTEVKAKMGAAHVGHLGQGRRITWKSEKRKGFFVAPTTTRPLRYPAVQKD